MQAQKFRTKQLGKDNQKNINSVLHHQDIFYILEIIRTKLIRKYYNDLPADYFGIKKTQKLFAQKYY